jgi:hypothetical protein
MANTQVEGTIHLPDGRLLPVLLSLDISALPITDSASDIPLFGRAMEVFGLVEKARHWLDSPSVELENQTPRLAAQSPEGRVKVLGILTDLEYGFPA